MKDKSRVSRERLAAVLAVFGAVATLGLFTGGCGEATPPVSSDGSTTTAGSLLGAPETAEIELMMDWIPWVLDIPVDVAQAKGFYQAAGLSVEQVLPVEATDVVKFVSTGKAQFGLYYAPDMLMAVEAGAPLVSIGSLMAHAPVGMALRPGLSADSPAVLVGETVSVPMIPSTQASFSSMLSTAGVDPESVAIIDPGFELIAPLLEGKVAAAAFTEFGELVAAEAQGQKLAYLDFRDWGTPDYSFLTVITTREFAQANPGTTRAFLRATLDGMVYAAANPEEAVSLYVQAHPELDGDLLLAQWKAAIPHLALSTATSAVGEQDLEAWEVMSTWMQGAGLLEEAVDIDSVVTNEYLKTAE